MGAQIPTATVEIGGEQYELRMTIGALKRMRDALGGNLSDVTLGGEEGVYAMPAVVHALMGAADRANLTVEDVEDMMGLHDIGAISSLIAQLQEESMPEIEEDENADPLPAKRGRKS